MDYTALESDILQYVEGIMRQDHGHTSDYCFHNTAHTHDVVRACKEIAHHYQLDEHDTFVLVAAAYFHDIGYISGGVENHEQRGAEVATAYLTEKGVDQETIRHVVRCILATRLIDGRTQPSDFMEEIICDADLFHFGTKHFFERDKLMYRELKNTEKCHLEQRNWIRNTISTLRKHVYYTDYANQLLSEQKQKNLIKLEEYLKNEEEYLPVAKDKKNKKKKKQDTNRPDRGIETMFRVTSSNNQRLSDMADNKANIMITVNSIIISLVIGLLMSKLDKNAHLAIPTFTLLICCLATMITSILATRPKIPEGYFRPQDVEDKSVNLLFFGNFYKMPLEKYTDGMLTVMDDRDFLYRMLIKDVYSQGIVLGRKFRLLRLSYNCFMIGLTVSIIGFSLSFIFVD